MSLPEAQWSTLAGAYRRSLFFLRTTRVLPSPAFAVLIAMFLVHPVPVNNQKDPTRAENIEHRMEQCLTICDTRPDTSDMNDVKAVLETN